MAGRNGLVDQRSQRVFFASNRRDWWQDQPGPVGLSTRSAPSGMSAFPPATAALCAKTAMVLNDHHSRRRRADDEGIPLADPRGSPG